MAGESDNPNGATHSTRRHIRVAPIQPGPAAAADDEPPEPLGLFWLLILAVAVGCITGFGAVVFRDLIGFVHNLLFLRQVSFAYDANHFTPASPWGALVILVPVIGGLLVTWIVENFAPEAKGHGVPEVMDAIYYKGGTIRPVVALVKSIASAFAIGSGAAVGREGPIIQIGSALGSTFGQLIRMTAGQRITLVAAGAGAGIAATFNTPIGGVLFATELMMPEISVDTFLPVVLATGTATFIGRLFFGAEAAFQVPAQLGAIPNQLSSVLTLALYAVLGALTGIAAAALIHTLHWAEDAFDRIPNRYLRHASGMLLVGVLIYVLWRNAGHYYVEGVGYASIQATLYGQLQGGALLLLLAASKLFATSVSQSRVRFVRRRVFTVAVHRRHAWRCDRFAHLGGRARRSNQRSRLRDGRHGRNGGRWYRGCHDGRRNDLRNDARLRHRFADDHCGSSEPGHAPPPVGGEHLYAQASSPRACHS